MLSKLAATLSPRQLRYQLALLTSLVLLLTIFVYAWYSASKQSASAQNRAELRVVALAQNIAASSTTAIINKDLAEVESLLVRMVGLPNIQEVRITDARGRLLSHVVRKPGGEPEVRFGSRTIDTPAAANAATRIDYSNIGSGWRHQLGLGDPGRVVVWLPIFSGTLLGWVVIEHDLASTAQIRKDIWLDSLSAGAIALIVSILLLLLFLKRPMGALQTATNFAARLDESHGAQLPVFHGSSEIESLTTGLNRASTRLLTQNRDLNNQKFALDQHAIVSVADLEGNITYANDLFCKVSGYSQAELIGKNHRIVNSGFHPTEVFSGLWRTISQGDVWHGELKNRHRDGSYYWVDVTIVPLTGADGRPQQYIAIRTDITELKRVDRMKTEFISTVSHELRTPLTAIYVSLDMLHTGMAGELPPDVKELMGIAHDSAGRLVRLINDVLDVERIESRNMVYHKVLQPLLPLVEQAITTTQSYAGQYQVKFELSSGSTDALVRVDADRVTQVLVNLLSNAAKFSPAGGAVVRINLQRLPRYVRVSVIDTGSGIPASFRDRVFERFAQADSSDRREKGGTGLGLSICKKIIEEHQGMIDFVSEPGKDCEFYFDLPLAEPV